MCRFCLTLFVMKKYIDVAKVLRHFGGPAAMRQMWASCGLALTKGAQDKWIMRDSLPTIRVIEAIEVARRKRLTFNLNSFLKANRSQKIEGKT